MVFEDTLYIPVIIIEQFIKEQKNSGGSRKETKVSTSHWLSEEKKKRGEKKEEKRTGRREKG